MGRHRPATARTRFAALALAVTLSSCNGTAGDPEPVVAGRVTQSFPAAPRLLPG